MASEVGQRGKEIGNGCALGNLPIGDHNHLFSPGVHELQNETAGQHQ